MNAPLVRSALSCLALLVLVACADDGGAESPTPADSGAPPSAPGPQLLASKLPGVPDLHRFGDLWLAGQPTADGLRALREQGVARVLDLRLPHEDHGFDEDAAAAALGLEYHNIGFATQDLTDQKVDAIRAILRDTSSPLLVHCRSANRVGMVWLLHRVLDGKLTPEQAMAEARTVGLASEGLEAFADGYLQRHR